MYAGKCVGMRDVKKQTKKLNYLKNGALLIMARVSSSGGGGGEASLPKHPASPPKGKKKREEKEREREERERGRGGGACIFWCCDM